MTYLFLIPIVYLAAVFETTVGPALDVGSAAPDMLALVALGWSLTIVEPRGRAAPTAIGFISDLISPGRLGAGLAWFAIVGCFLTVLRTHFGVRRFFVLALWAWPAATLMVLGPAAIHRALGEFEVNWITLALRGLTVSASTAALTLPVLSVAAWFRRRRRVSLYFR